MPHRCWYRGWCLIKGSSTPISPPTPVCLCTGLPQWPTEGPASCGFPLNLRFPVGQVERKALTEQTTVFDLMGKLFFFSFLLQCFLDQQKVSSCPWFIYPRCRWLLHDICVTIKEKQKHIQSKLCGRNGCPLQLTWCPIQSRRPE